MRIGVPGLDDLLFVGQLGPQLHAVVVVFTALRKQHVKRPEELRKQVGPVVHPRGETLIEIASGGVERAIQRPAVAVQDIPRFGHDPTVDVDGLEPALRSEFES